MKTKRLIRFQIARECFASIFEEGKEHHYKITKGLPKDTQIWDVWFNPEKGDHFGFLAESKEFDELKEGEIIPLKVLEFDRIK